MYDVYLLHQCKWPSGLITFLVGHSWWLNEVAGLDHVREVLFPAAPVPDELAHQLSLVDSLIQVLFCLGSTLCSSFLECRPHICDNLAVLLKAPLVYHILGQLV